jgi:hypothetical protein
MKLEEPMKIEKIFELWAEDSKINRLDLVNESLSQPELHYKYYKIYINEKLTTRGYESDLKKLRFDKHEFYTSGPTEITNEKGWKLPASGRILKADVNNYLDVDPDIVFLTLKIGIQHEKIEFLKSIIDSISKRTFQIKNAIEMIKFENGV